MSQTRSYLSSKKVLLSISSHSCGCSCCYNSLHTALGYKGRNVDLIRKYHALLSHCIVQPPGASGHALHKPIAVKRHSFEPGPRHTHISVFHFGCYVRARARVIVWSKSRGVIRSIDQTDVGRDEVVVRNTNRVILFFGLSHTPFSC